MIEHADNCAWKGTAMKKLLNYSTKYIDNELKRVRLCLKSTKPGIDLGSDKEVWYQRLDQRIAERAYDWIINSLCDLFWCYATEGDLRMQLDTNTKTAKESYYLAASIGVLCYEMIEKGFSHHVVDSGYPYDFKKKNFNFSKTAILANEYEMALKMTGNDTVEGALVLEDYQMACKILPESPEDDSIGTDDIRQCMWAVAHGDEMLFNKYMEKRIKILRRYARLSPRVFDSWGLAVVKLAQRRGLKCNLNVIELPYQLLDDIKIDASGLFFPKAEQVRSIIDEKGISQIEG